ncbi:glycine cleavage system aminomethyltransferase GcvT [Gracilibacillus suaedae]|uniref:glycine cleavage system aminomethyltransferase GcvT n=1 Tax=Gracilibacillus suaedae TaxID=2820273 RepID=UPI001ABD9C79|nr:glycine cleavage system aminomethyltransferase GcvT [Gracilibacillus suaedae]
MSDPTALKRTPLFALYKSYGAKVIDFGGWALPVHFSSIIDEHHAVRTKAGLFDVSHMGEILIEGKNAESFVNYLMTNDITNMAINQAKYTAMCYEDGGTVDDLLVYKLDHQKFFLVVNAANTDKDFEWINKYATEDVLVTNISDQIVQLAIQGPDALQILQQLTDIDLNKIGTFRFIQNVKVAGVTNCLVSRTGYTGEDGFEIYLASNEATKLWRELLSLEEAPQPCGLGSRDTLRFEAALALYGQELTSSITPIEAGIDFTVKTQKYSDFIGKVPLTKEKENGPIRKLVGLEIIGKGIPRHGYQVFTPTDKEIGFITSGTHSPTLKKALGLALVQQPYAEIGTKLKVKVRNKLIDAVVVHTPFYQRRRGLT